MKSIGNFPFLLIHFISQKKGSIPSLPPSLEIWYTVPLNVCAIPDTLGIFLPLFTCTCSPVVCIVWAGELCLFREEYQQLNRVSCMLRPGAAVTFLECAFSVS